MTTYIIYKLCNTLNTEIYVGCTKTTLGARLAVHKCDAGRHKDSKLYRNMNRIGLDLHFMTVLEEIKCDSDESARAVEQSWIDRLKPSLNTYKAHTGMSVKEYYGAYRKNNRTKIREWGKQYHCRHREQMAEKNRRYREKLGEKWYGKIECGCGSVIVNHNLKQHQKSIKHQKWQAYIPKSLPMVDTTLDTAATGKAMGAPIPVAARPVAIDPTPAATSLTLTAPP